MADTLPCKDGNDVLKIHDGLGFPVFLIFPLEGGRPWEYSPRHPRQFPAAVDLAADRVQRNARPNTSNGSDMALWPNSATSLCLFAISA